MQRKRCIIPADGFYEWREEDGGKQPYLFHRKDGQALLLTGIWDISTYKDDERASFAILTDEPNALIAPYHERMPVCLHEEAAAAWLDLNQHPTPDAALMLDLNAFAVRPMLRAMNNAKEKDLLKIDPDAA